jgi:hypothetical protein
MAKQPRRKPTPPEIERIVLTNSRRGCAVCFHLDRDTRQKKGQIAHLDHRRANSVEDNLAWLCLDHHSEYDSVTSQHKNYTIYSRALPARPSTPLRQVLSPASQARCIRSAPTWPAMYSKMPGGTLNSLARMPWVPLYQKLWVLIGGAAYRAKPDLWADIGADGFAMDFKHCDRSCRSTRVAMSGPMGYRRSFQSSDVVRADGTRD